MASKNQNLYLGNYLHFATGEGYHSHLLLVQANNKTSALEKFLDKLMSRYPHCDKNSRNFFKAGITIQEVSKVKLSQFAPPWKDIIASVQDLCKQGGMAGGDFEVVFDYNLS